MSSSLEHVIIKNLDLLSSNTSNFTKLVVCLMSQYVIEVDEKQALENCETDYSRNTELFLLMRKKGPETLPKLCNALEESGNSHLAQQLRRDSGELFLNTTEDISRNSRNDSTSSDGFSALHSINSNSSETGIRSDLSVEDVFNSVGSEGTDEVLSYSESSNRTSISVQSECDNQLNSTGTKEGDSEKFIEQTIKGEENGTNETQEESGEVIKQGTKDIESVRFMNYKYHRVSVPYIRNNSKELILQGSADSYHQFLQMDLPLSLKSIKLEYVETDKTYFSKILKELELTHLHLINVKFQGGLQNISLPTLREFVYRDDYFVEECQEVIDNELQSILFFCDFNGTDELQHKLEKLGVQIKVHLGEKLALEFQPGKKLKITDYNNLVNGTGFYDSSNSLFCTPSSSSADQLHEVCGKAESLITVGKLPIDNPICITAIKLNYVKIPVHFLRSLAKCVNVTVIELHHTTFVNECTDIVELPKLIRFHFSDNEKLKSSYDFDEKFLRRILFFVEKNYDWNEILKLGIDIQISSGGSILVDIDHQHGYLHSSLSGTHNILEKISDIKPSCKQLSLAGIHITVNLIPVGLTDLKLFLVNFTGKAEKSLELLLKSCQLLEKIALVLPGKSKSDFPTIKVSNFCKTLRHISLEFVHLDGDKDHFLNLTSISCYNCTYSKYLWSNFSKVLNPENVAIMGGIAATRPTYSFLHCLLYNATTKNSNERSTARHIYFRNFNPSSLPIPKIKNLLCKTGIIKPDNTCCENFEIFVEGKGWKGKEVDAPEQRLRRFRLSGWNSHLSFPALMKRFY